MQYIELNPVRAGMVSHPGDYPWSSYSANAQGHTNAILTPHQEFLSLAKEKAERLNVYRHLSESKMSTQLLTDFRKSIQSGTPLGGQLFLDQIEKKLNCNVGFMKQGRPLKNIVKN